MSFPLARSSRAAGAIPESGSKFFGITQVSSSRDLVQSRDEGVDEFQQYFRIARLQGVSNDGIDSRRMARIGERPLFVASARVHAGLQRHNVLVPPVGANAR